MTTAEKKTFTDKVIRWGAIAGAISAMLVLVAVIFAAGDKYGAAPYVRERALPLLKAHECADSVKWVNVDKKIKSVEDLSMQQFKVMTVYIKASMTEEAKRRASDELVNDTTIHPILKMQ